MQLRSSLSPAELGEGFRLNRTKSFWFRMALANWYALALTCAVLWAAASSLIHPTAQGNWGTIGILLGVAGLLLAFSWYRVQRQIAQTARKLGSADGVLALQEDGVRESAPGGALSFIPWSEYTSWKEGPSVFTLTSSKGFRCLPKSGLSDAEVAQLRNYLQSKIR